MNPEVIQQTTAKHTTMVTMDYVFNEDTDTDNDNTEESTEAVGEVSLEKNVHQVFGADLDQTTPEVATNHSVQWLSEDGDIMVPVVDHETTTMVKIGHVDDTELDFETTPRAAPATTTTTTTTASPTTVMEEEIIEPEVKVEDETNENVLWTTEAPVEEATEPELADVELKNEASVVEEAETTTTATTAAAEETLDVEVKADTDDALATTTVATTTTTSTTTEPHVIFFEEPEETTFSAIDETADAVAVTITTTTPSTTTAAPVEATTTMIEISFAMDGHKEMPEEFQEKLEDSINSIIHDMTTTTTISPEEELANDYNVALLTRANVVQDAINAEHGNEEQATTQSSEEGPGDEVVESQTEISIETPDSEEIKPETPAQEVPTTEKTEPEVKEGVEPAPVEVQLTTVASEQLPATTTVVAEPAPVAEVLEDESKAAETTPAEPEQPQTTHAPELVAPDTAATPQPLEAIQATTTSTTTATPEDEELIVTTAAAAVVPDALAVVLTTTTEAPSVPPALEEDKEETEQGELFK